MSGRRSNHSPKALSPDRIHSVVDAEVKLALLTAESAQRDDDSFNDALHQLINATPRPKTEADLAQLSSRLCKLIFLCGEGEDDTSRSRWISFTLSIIHRRYHLRAPEARAEKLKAGEDSEIATGDGERLFFYVAVLCMMKFSIQVKEKNEKAGAMVQRALKCLFHIAPHAGGSRDMCALIEFGLYEILREVLLKKDDKFSNSSFLSSSELTGWALGTAMKSMKEEKNSVFALVEDLLQLAAETIDADMEIIAKEGSSNDGAEEEKLISTLNVFLPHHDRGRQSSKKRLRDGEKEKAKLSDRNLVQCVAELLIWSKTAVVSSNESFTSSFDNIVQNAKSPDEGVWALRGPDDRERHKSEVKSRLHRMQTIARRQRKVLNAHARSKGFMLTDQYSLDPETISLSMIKRGKAGDLSRLAGLAGKSGGTRVLDMINVRNMDLSRAVPMESLASLKANWVPLSGDSGDDVRTAKLKLQEATVRSTLKKLRKSHNASLSASCLVASLDDSKLNHAASILLGAAMSSWVDEQKDSAGEGAPSETKAQRVHIQERIVDVGSFDACMESLDSVFTADAEDDTTDAVATTKAVLNLIDRHVSDGDTLLLLTTSDLRLPDHSLSDLQERGCSLHCHTADALAERLKREGARTGDVTISLMWDTGDDLDLHVVMPSGEEISYSNKASKCGLGCLDVDMNAGGAQSTEPVENVFLGRPDECVEAPKGKYKVFVQNYAYHSSKRNSPVTFRVSIRMNGRVQDHAGACVGTGGQSDQTVCEFDYQGRTVPFEKELENKSAFGTANLVSLTASTGQTLESLCQLMRTVEEHGELDRVRELVADGDAPEEAEEGADEDMEISEDEQETENGGEMRDGDGTETPAEEDARSAPARPLVAAHGRLELTSRDRLHATLCKLPKRFHDEVKRCFGVGETLMETCAADIARRMLRDNVRLSDLRASGYPSEVVGIVSSIMKKGAVCPAS